MTTDLTASKTAVDVPTSVLELTPTPASDSGAPSTPALGPTPALELDATPDPTPVPAPAPTGPKPKPITWETERNAAVAALARVGATPREARVLASLAANAATELRSKGRDKNADPAVIDDRAATKVLAAHRAAASPAWMK